MMKGAISFKTIIIIVILLLVGVLGVLGMSTVRTYLGSAAAGSEPKGVLATPGEDGKSASISWTTDKPAQAVVEYGTTPASLLLRSVESDATTDHKVTITPLKSGVNYYFRIKVGEDVYDNNGIPFSFKSKEATEAPGSETVPTVPPKAVTSPPVGGTAPTCSQTQDYNKDGVVNSLDYLQCIRSGGATGSSPTPGTGNCVGGVDYDGNGTINSLDVVKCLQKR